MVKIKNSLIWIEEGYNLFAQEGIEGFQVERLARILQFNKSGFYHYFGDQEGFCDELLMLHEKKVSLLLSEIREARFFDPDYLQLLIDHRVTLLFQMQLTRHKTNHDFYALSRKVDQLIDEAVSDMWCDFLGIHSRTSDVAIRYYGIVRDMLYTRISFKNLNYLFLHDLVHEAKEVADDLLKHQMVLVTGETHSEYKNSLRARS